MTPKFWEPKRELESCGICEVSSTGLSLKLTIDEEIYYIGLKDLDNVLRKHRPNATIVRLVELETSVELGDPQSQLTPKIRQQTKHEAYLLNLERKRNE